MIIIVNGAIGVGKTSVSWALLKRLEPAAMLDGDHIAAVSPFSVLEPSHLAYAYQSIAHLAHFHRQNAYQNIIINYVFETVTELDKMKALLGLPVYAFVLTCERGERERRIRQRATIHTNLDWEIPRSNALHQQLAGHSAEGALGLEIDTSKRTVEAVAEEILQHINKHSDGD